MTQRGYEVVVYDDSWEGAQGEFARRNWPGKARRADAGYLRWEYRGPVSGPVPGLLLAVAGSDVVGQLGMIPGRGRFEGRERPVQWIGNLMVDPGHRRRGISTSMLRMAMDRPVVTLGTDPSPAAQATMSTLGFARSESSSLMVLPLSAGTVASVRYPRVRPMAPLIDLAGRGLVRARTRRTRVAARGAGAWVCRWSDVVGAVAMAETTPGSRSLHDDDFLGWRCGGFAPWMREVDAVTTAAGSFALVEKAGDRMSVLHWSAHDERDTAAVFGRLLFLARSHGMAYLQAFAADARQVSQLTGVGFLERRSPTDLWAYPATAVGPSGFAVEGYDTDQNL